MICRAARTRLSVGAALPAALFLLTGCASLPEPRSGACAGAPPPQISTSPDERTARLFLDVLTYNIEGLSWPARSGRRGDLEAIGSTLAALRERGEAPDVVVFQEVFSRPAAAAVGGAGYPALAAGPARAQRRVLPRAGKAQGQRKWRRGELGLRLASGGLAIVSRYPIVAEASEPFSRKSCAGFDCLSNKGALFARIAIPGVPEPIELFNTHMNSQRASKAGPKRRNSAHEVQAVELEAFIEAAAGAGHPTLLAGDFNMRRSDARYRAFRPSSRLSLVHQHCLEQGSGCDVRLSWDGDAPWMDTQDLQYFASGDRVRVRPVRVAAMFDGRPGSPRLSDHDGFRVVYELTWTVGPTRAMWSCPETPARVR